MKLILSIPAIGCTILRIPGNCVSVLIAVALYLLAMVASASDCVVPVPGATKPVNLRATPSAGSAVNGTLGLGQSLPLVALVPGWYETRLASGQMAFAAKRSTQISPCVEETTAVGAAGEASFEIHAIDVGTGLSILVRGTDFALLYDAGSNDDLARGDDNRTIAYLKTDPVNDNLRRVQVSGCFTN